MIEGPLQPKWYGDKKKKTAQICDHSSIALPSSLSRSVFMPQPNSPLRGDLSQAQPLDLSAGFTSPTFSPSDPKEKHRSDPTPIPNLKKQISEPDPIPVNVLNDPFDPLQTGQSETLSLSSPFPTLPAPSSRKKRRQSPTRRSQRLREKSQLGIAPQNLTLKTKTAILNIPFLPNSQQTPIEEDAALQILQASGLKITNEVESMIQEATMLDHSDEDPDHFRPQTPLHDLIPPRLMPGDGMLL